jgi:hypothetical protein
MADRPLLLDLGDFDAVGVATDVVVALRVHAIEHGCDAAATVDAPAGYQRPRRDRPPERARGARDPLQRPRPLPLEQPGRRPRAAGWQVDDDGEGATRRYPPGSQASDAAFEALAAVTLVGAPSDVRVVTAVDGEGSSIVLGG